jgi:hypothetical protein
VGEELEAVVGGGTRFGGVDDDGQPLVGGDFQSFEVQVKVSDDGVVDLF